MKLGYKELGCNRTRLQRNKDAMKLGYKETKMQ